MLIFGLCMFAMGGSLTYAYSQSDFTKEDVQQYCLNSYLWCCQKYRYLAGCVQPKKIKRRRAMVDPDED
jgi:hypothetical protein